MLGGSHHVQDFKLDERLAIEVVIEFLWKTPPSGSHGNGSAAEGVIQAEGSITVEVSE